MKVRCHCCKKSRNYTDTHSVPRVGAGSYNRAPRRYHAQVCAFCLFELLSYKQEGHQYVGAERYEVLYVETALKALNPFNGFAAFHGPHPVSTLLRHVWASGAMRVVQSIPVSAASHEVAWDIGKAVTRTRSSLIGGIK